MPKPILIYLFYALVILFSGCIQPVALEGNANGNQPPEILSLKAETLTLKVGQSTKISVDARDPEGGQLSYRWFVLLGDIIGNGKEVRYTAAFCCAGVNEVIVTVKDSQGASTKKSINIFVSE